MAKRSKEESIGVEDDGVGLEEGTQQSKVEEENKSQGRPSRNTRKVVKYTDFDDEFESDFDDEMDFIDEEDEGDSDVEEEEDDEANNDDDLDLEDEEPERSKKSKKSATKKKSDTNASKAPKSKKSSKESMEEEDLDSEEEEEEEKGSTKAVAKKKKLIAPKNLTKRNVASSGGGASVHGDAGEAIFNYMKEQNRPYSVQNVVDNLHNVYSKRQVTDEMDRLAVEGKFVCKEYGKQKVYLIDQSDCKELNKEEMEALDKMISASESELSDLEARLKQLKQETRNISVPLPINVLEERIEQESLKVGFIIG